MRNFLSKGFTLIEVMIVIAILGIFAAIFIPQFSGYKSSDHQCIAGFKFTKGGKQIIGQNGSGVPCDEIPKGFK